MPYIKKSCREIYDYQIDTLIHKLKKAPDKDIAGDFTYIVYRLLKIFSGKYWMRALGMGCMVMAVMEMYRKDHAVYETIKEIDNGSV